MYNDRLCGGKPHKFRTIPAHSPAAHPTILENSHAILHARKVIHNGNEVTLVASPRSVTWRRATASSLASIRLTRHRPPVTVSPASPHRSLDMNSIHDLGGMHGFGPVQP